MMQPKRQSWSRLTVFTDFQSSGLQKGEMLLVFRVVFGYADDKMIMMIKPETIAVTKMTILMMAMIMMLVMIGKTLREMIMMMV